MIWKKMNKRWSNLIVVALVFCSTACVNNSPVSESEYSTKIIGSWEGPVIGELKETMSLKPDSTFVCYVRPIGFIATTLSQSLPGTIRGKWKINGATITMQVTDEKNEHVKNKNSSSTIVAFKQDSLVLSSDRGDTSVFRRVFHL
jgi:hypothetical protein